MMSKVVAIIATVDSKAAEVFYLHGLINARGYTPVIVDVSCRPHRYTLGAADIPNSRVAEAAGLSLQELETGVKGRVASKMADGVSKVVSDLYRAGGLDGVIGIGGSIGAELATAGMRALPIGVPKLCISTIQHTQPLVGSKDIAMLYPVTDLAGGERLNRFERIVLKNAVGAMVGMLETIKEEGGEERPLVLASMMGSTTPCVRGAREVLEKEGYEVAVFHAQGSGGRAIEELVRGGGVSGVLDITTSELASELAGGPLTAGPDRLKAAVEMGVPQVVCPGALDIIPFWGYHMIPPRYEDRCFHQHSPSVVNMRTSKEEAVELAKTFAQRLNSAKAPVSIVIPERGWSEYDLQGGVQCVDSEGRQTTRSWYDPETDKAFTETLARYLDRSNPNITLVTVDAHLNDDAFASEVAAVILDMLGRAKKM